MAIITCPECGQNPVSDRAATCPKCGCPIAAANASVAPVHPRTESTNQAPTIRQERNAKLEPFNAAVLDSTEYSDTSVGANDLTNLAELVGHIQGWCEELRIVPCVDTRHVDAISRLSSLKSLILYSPGLNDEALYRISKLQTLRRLEIYENEARTQPSSWIQLGRLSGLEYLQLPVFLFPNDYSSATDDVKKLLRLKLTGAIIK